MSTDSGLVYDASLLSETRYMQKTVSEIDKRLSVIERISEDRGVRINGKIADHSGDVGELEKQVLELISKTSNIKRDIENIDERSKRVYEQHDRMKIYLIITLVVFIMTLISKFIGM